MPSPNPTRSRKPRWRRWLAGVVAAAAAVVAIAHERVRYVGGRHVVAPELAPVAAAAVVPGARILPDGTPYDMLADRLRTAHELFVAGRVPLLVVSGLGGGTVAEDEVAAMRRWLEQRGVPPAAIVDDPVGLRTIDTMQNLRARFGAAPVVLVSNAFHVARCVYLARGVGVDAVGVAAPPGRDYSASTLRRNQLREAGARVLAWGELLPRGWW